MSKVKMVRSLAAAAIGVVGLLAAAGTAHADDVPEVDDEVIVGFDTTSPAGRFATDQIQIVSVDPSSAHDPNGSGTYNFTATYSGDGNSAALPGTYRFVAVYSGDAN